VLQPLDEQQLRKQHRWKRRVFARVLRDVPALELGICRTIRAMLGWAALVVAESKRAAPMGMMLTSAPPCAFRECSSYVSLYGDIRPGGAFTVEFPDGSIALPSPRPRLSNWPPTSPRRKWGLIVG
jgi:hypothetical protein